MQKLFLVVSILVTMLAEARLVRAGDFGGGGTLVTTQEFQLDVGRLKDLKRSPDLQVAFDKWVDKMSEEERERVYTTIFKEKIVPQLEKNK